MDVVSGITDAVYEVGDVINDMIMASEVSLDIGCLIYTHIHA
jgi:hypothetical protein